MSASVTPDLKELFAQFPPAADEPAFATIPASEVPPPYHDLLVHDHHMTVTVEAYHGDLVNVQVLDKRRSGSFYSRKILLSLQKTGKVVQFGIVRVNLDYLPEAAQAEIVAEKKPFGRVLIEHDVLRRIEPTAYLRIEGGPKQMAWFGQTEPRPLYGRLAIIHCDEQPAVELLEIVAPEDKR